MFRTTAVAISLALFSAPAGAQTCIDLGGGFTSCSNGQMITNLGSGIAVDNFGDSAINLGSGIVSTPQGPWTNLGGGIVVGGVGRA